jgi:hypothetical protein
MEIKSIFLRGFFFPHFSDFVQDLDSLFFIHGVLKNLGSDLISNLQSSNQKFLLFNDVFDVKLREVAPEIFHIFMQNNNRFLCKIAQFESFISKTSLSTSSTKKLPIIGIRAITSIMFYILA